MFGSAMQLELIASTLNRRHSWFAPDPTVELWPDGNHEFTVAGILGHFGMLCRQGQAFGAQHVTGRFRRGAAIASSCATVGQTETICFFHNDPGSAPTTQQTLHHLHMKLA
jgi:hypothetical protein